MDKTKTLQPFCITDGSAFGKILESSQKKDYRTVDGLITINVGTIGFEYESIHRLSKACRYKKLHADFSQSGGDLGWTNWHLTPCEISDFDVTDGTRLTRYTAGAIGFEKKTGSHDLDGWYSQSYDFTNGNAPQDLFGSNMIGLSVSASNDAVVSQKLWMKELTLTLTYTARYYAKFYSDGTQVCSTQTVDGGNSAAAPNITKTGYRLKGWKCGGTIYEANELPTSQDTDLRFDAEWERIYYKVTLPQKTNASCRVTNLNGQYIYQITNNETWVAHGDSIKVYATGFNTRAENLLVRVNGGEATEKDGSSGGEILIYEGAEGAVTQTLTIEVSTKVISFPLTIVRENAGGEVNAPASITRFANARITVQSYAGYCLDYVELDGTRTTFSGETESWTHLLESVNESHTLEVRFKPKQLQVTFNVGPHVTVLDENGTDVTSGTSVDYGSDPAFTFCVPAGYSLDTVHCGEEQLLNAFKQVLEFTAECEPVTNAVAFSATETNDLAAVAISQTTGGTVTGDTGNFIIGKGALEFLATPEDAYQFDEWFDGTYDALSKEIPITEDVVVSATFRERDYTVIAIAATAGDGERHVSFAEQTQKNVLYLSADRGENVEIPFYPEEGYIVDELYLSHGGQDEAYYPEGRLLSPYIEENVQDWVQIFFTMKVGNWEISLVSNTPEEGNKIKIGDRSSATSDSAEFLFHSEVELEAIPVTGWHLAYWSDDQTNSRKKRTYTVPGRDVEITAVFQKDKEKINVETGEGGTATPSAVVEYGDEYLLEIKADIGQKIADVLLDGKSIYDDVTLTRRGGRFLLSEITEPHSFKVLFEPKTYTNNRKLYDYWPPVIQRIREMQEIARVQQPMIDELWDATSWLMENQCIDTATEEAVILWEKELGIVPSPSDTLRQRKARLKLKWVPHNRFTLPWLYNWLRSATGRDDIQPPCVPENTYGLQVRLPWDADWRTIFSDLKRYKPCNIWLDPHVDTPDSNIHVLAGFAIGSWQERTYMDENQADRYEKVFDEQEGRYKYQYKESETGQ